MKKYIFYMAYGCGTLYYIKYIKHYKYMYVIISVSPNVAWIFCKNIKSSEGGTAAVLRTPALTGFNMELIDQMKLVQENNCSESVSIVR